MSVEYSHSNDIAVFVSPIVEMYVSERSVTGFSTSVEPEMDVESITVEEDEAQHRWPDWVRPSMVDRFLRLKSFQTAHELLMQGFPDIEIARQIQTLGEMVDVSLKHVTNVVRHYKHSLPKHEIVSRLLPSRTIEPVNIGKPVVLRVELADLYHKAKQRVERALKREIDLDGLIPTTDKAFATTLDTLDRIITIADKLGMTEEKEQTQSRSSAVDWDAVYSRPGMNDVMGDEKSRYRMVKFVESLAGMYGKMDPAKQAKVLELAAKGMKKEYSISDAEMQAHTRGPVPKFAPVNANSVRKVVSEEPIEEYVPSKRQPG